MVIYRPSVSVPSISGAVVDAGSGLRSWQPTTWPEAGATCDSGLIVTIRKIFDESILSEIDNVIADAQRANGSLEHRGYVVAIALMCALDAISSHGYGARCGAQIPDFVRAHMPVEYYAHADDLLKLYRHALVHSWHLFEVTIRPGAESISVENNVVCFGLLHLRKAISHGTADYLKKLETDPILQTRTLERYNSLKSKARV